MFMNIGLITAAAAAGICVLSAAATCIYRAGYEKMISKRLAAGAPARQSGKPMLSPLSFFWLCAAVLGILTMLVLSVVSFASERPAALRVSRCAPDGITAMLDAQDEISGYERHTAQNGPFEFVFYVQDQTGDAAFPQILIYTESGSSEPFSYQYRIRGDREAPLSEAQQGKSGWYAVNCEQDSGVFVFTCENKTGSGSIEITLPQ